MKKIFLSGPISNKVNLNAGIFNDYAKVLRDAGFIVMVPHELMLQVDTSEFEHGDFCKRCIQYMLECQIVCQLPGWQNSPGAAIEKAVADLFKIPCKTIEEILETP